MILEGCLVKATVAVLKKSVQSMVPLGIAYYSLKCGS